MDCPTAILVRPFGMAPLRPAHGWHEGHPEMKALGPGCFHI
ncbi:hypothetical protein OCGS_1996 [Oceaniovalibus guishaninsula JLT2003]|uniref:Uncharacterized protein n=1 Tax=Oceaniovalibus guishaninsula JLT2003 TaxID=1231392 RepID=K2I515_9RHOB|nr:hypothetical protein OCGS_1996 [Oceaniovalibus guishaninsula JLT2003]